MSRPETPLSRSTDERPSSRDGYGYWAVVASATVAIGAMVVAVGLIVAGSGPFVALGAAVGALGLAVLVFSAGGLTDSGTTPVRSAGLGVSVLAVLLAATGVSPLGLGTAVPGGVWILLYAVGLLVAVWGGVRTPAEPPEGGSIDAGGVSVDGNSTVVMDRDGDRWIWRLVTDDGTVLASTPERYETRRALQDAVGRLTDALDADLRTVWAPSVESESEERPSVDVDDGDQFEVTEDGSEGAPAPSGSVVAAGDEDAAFELRETDRGWEWRIHYDGETLLAESGRAFADLDAAKRAVERVRSQAAAAGALTYDPAAFEVYPDPTGERRTWRWRLRRAGGEVVAASVEGFDTRGDAMGGIRRAKDAVDGDPAVEEADGHRWYLEADGEVLARSPHGFETREAAVEAFEAVRESVTDAGVLELDPAGFAVSEREGATWGWQLRHRDGRVLARSPGHASRDRAIEGLRTFKRVVPHADRSVEERRTSRIIEEALSDAADARSVAERIPDADWGEDDGSEGSDTTDEGSDAESDAAPETDGEDGEDPGDRLRAVVAPDDGEWSWRLRYDGRTVATAGGHPAREAAVAEAERVADRLRSVPVATLDPAAVELHEDDDWRWRLVDADGAILAGGSESHVTSDDARTAAEAALAALDSDPEIYRDDGWRWRVRDGMAVVAASDEGFDTTDGAEAAFETVRERAADAPIVECPDGVVEVYPVEGEWGWRLRDADGRVLVGGQRRAGTADEVAAAIEDVADAVPEDPVVTPVDGAEDHDED